jgi:cytochrome c
MASLLSPLSPRSSCLLALPLLACMSNDPPRSEGESVYREPIADGNSFTCATCHALTEPSADGLRRPGHPIGDATRRPSWKHGQLDDMRLAVNSCLQEWMNAEPWTADEPRWLALYQFLDGQAPSGEAPALSYTIVSPPDELGGGDPDAGRDTFNRSCAVCHGHDGSGTNQAPPVVGFGYAPAYSAQRIRTSGRSNSPIYPDLTGGIMPFWAAERLSDAELRDLVAYLEVFVEPTDPTTGDGDGDGDPGPLCPATSERVGWTAELEDFFHDVGGTAEIVDDCTVVITDFHYDGTGIDVRIYGGQDGDYHNGYPMTDDLLRPGGYAGTTLYAKLPIGETVDQLDGVSVWCVDVGIDFGSGLFGPPTGG